MPTNQTPTPRPDAATITEQVTRLEREVNGLRGRAYRGVTLRGEDFIDALDRIACLREALGASRAGAEDLNAVKREAASKAWDAAWSAGASYKMRSDSESLRDRYLAREYPEARRHVVLSNDLAVSYDPIPCSGPAPWKAVRGHGRGSWTRHASLSNLLAETNATPTDDELRAALALAAAVQQEGA